MNSQVTSPMPATQVSAGQSGPTTRRTLVRRGLIAAGVSVGVCGLGFGLAALAPRANPGASKSGQTAGATLDTFEVTTLDFEITTTATGDIRAAKQIEIRNTIESETTVTEIIPEGSSVKAGEVLVRLNAENIQQRLDEERLSLESSRAQVVDAEQGYQIQLSENESSRRAANLKLTLSKLEFEQWLDGDLMSRQQDLEHALERAEKEEVRLREKLEKSAALYEKGYYSLDQFKQDELSREQAVNTLSKAQLDKDVFWEFEYPKQRKTKESNVEEASAELERVIRQNQARIASKEASLNNSRSALTIREQKFAKYQEQVNGATIKAPSDGLVVYATSIENSRWGGDEGPLQVGSRVYPNQNLIVLPDTSEMVAAVRVHESLASRVRKGQHATVKVEAAGNERYSGVVESIGILAEQTSRWMDPNLREYTVRIMLDLPKAAPDAGSETGEGAPRKVAHALKPSMRCEAEIQLGSVTGATAIPIQAVFNEGPLRFVYVPEGSRFTRRPVQLGQRSERYAEIRAGLKIGERVLVRKPDASEVVSRAWDEQELAAVGMRVNDQGQVEMAPGSGGGGGGGDRPSRKRAGGPPAASAKPSVPAAPAPAPESLAKPQGAQPSASADKSVTTPGESASK